MTGLFALRIGMPSGLRPKAVFPLSIHLHCSTFAALRCHDKDVEGMAVSIIPMKSEGA